MLKTNPINKKIHTLHINNMFNSSNSAHSILSKSKFNFNRELDIYYNKLTEKIHWRRKFILYESVENAFEKHFPLESC